MFKAQGLGFCVFLDKGAAYPSASPMLSLPRKPLLWRWFSPGSREQDKKIEGAVAMV